MLIEVLGMPSIWGLMATLFVLSIVMQQIYNRLPLMCQSVHVIHVPWGILWVTVFAHLWGFITYKQVVILAFAYLAAYPFMWILNYKFTTRLGQLLKAKRISRENTGVFIWASEIMWVWRFKRWWRHLTGRDRLNEEIINRILDYHGHNGYSVQHRDRSETIHRDN